MSTQQLDTRAWPVAANSGPQGLGYRAASTSRLGLEGSQARMTLVQAPPRADPFMYVGLLELRAGPSLLELRWELVLPPTSPEFRESIGGALGQSLCVLYLLEGPHTNITLYTRPNPACLARKNGPM